MKKWIQLISIIPAITLAIAFLAPHISNTNSPIIYLHEQTQKRSPKTLLDSFVNTGKVIVVFYADWCGPCKRMKPIIDELASELSIDFTIIKVNIDHYRELFDEYELKTVPAMLFFHNGIMVYKQPESTTKKELKRIIKVNY